MAMDRRWLVKQIAAYRAEQPTYKRYARVLMDVLRKACDLYAPLAIVQSRAKGVSSFAEKAVRKSDKYDDPAHQLTDLCGARVITRTLQEAKDICRFIRASMAVDEANSEDVRRRLRVQEFGYLSFHYVVQLQSDRVLGIATCRKRIADRKAEIQVRTTLQHAWADVSHDRLYKSPFHVPDRFYRRGGVLAASLERADEDFARFENDFLAYEVDMGNELSQEAYQKERGSLRLILAGGAAGETDVSVAVRLARLLRSRDEYGEVIDLLKPLARAHGPLAGHVLLELGRALVCQHAGSPQSPPYRQGQQYLARAAQLDDPDDDREAGLRADLPRRAAATFALAESVFRQRDGQTQAREFYRRATARAQENPYYLAGLLEAEVHCSRSWEMLPALKPMVVSAIKACRSHAEAGIAPSQAFLTMGRLSLFLGERLASLSCYARAIHACHTMPAACAARLIDRELECLRRVNVGRRPPEDHLRIERLLAMGKRVLRGPHRVSARSGRTWREPVTIIAGGTSQDIRTDVAAHRTVLKAALRACRGTVISGGTNCGMPGLVGEIAGRLKASGERHFKLVGYPPGALSAGVSLDRRYDRFETSEADSLEAIHYWEDLLIAGISPDSVRVLGISGGDVAAAEYRIAAGLGARVGVIEGSGRAAGDIVLDPDWAGAEKICCLPNDVDTVRAFLARSDSSDLSGGVLEKLGEEIHAAYVRENWRKVSPISVQDWQDLPEELRESNRQQAAYYDQVLREVGFGLRKSSRSRLPQFTKAQVERMAEMEHGRWNAERLAAGWRRASVKDVEHRLSPYLVGWKELPEGVREFDRQAVRALPGILARAGLEAYRL